MREKGDPSPDGYDLGLSWFWSGMHPKIARVAVLELDSVLSFEDGGTDRQLVARQVILALPPRLMVLTVDFEPVINSETLLRWRKTATWMAPHAKFFALHDRLFWRESGLSGTAQSGVEPLVEIHDMTLASGPAAL